MCQEQQPFAVMRCHFSLCLRRYVECLSMCWDMPLMPCVSCSSGHVQYVQYQIVPCWPNPRFHGNSSWADFGVHSVRAVWFPGFLWRGSSGLAVSGGLHGSSGLFSRGMVPTSGRRLSALGNKPAYFSLSSTPLVFHFLDRLRERPPISQMCPPLIANKNQWFVSYSFFLQMSWTEVTVQVLPFAVQMHDVIMFHLQHLVENIDVWSTESKKTTTEDYCTLI